MTPEVASGPTRVAVLIATFNGASFLPQQLDTIERQSVPLVDVWASDDGSSDETVSLLKSTAQRWKKGRFNVADGPRKGLSENFRSLLQRGDVDADFIAFADQDDIWLPDKLEKAIDWLKSQDPARPALYCCRVELVDEHGQSLGLSPLFGGKTDLRNALVQSIAGGNTVVLNRAAHELLRESARRTSFVIHDWWAYLLVTAAGGHVHYAPEPSVKYRQHSGNVIGSNTSWTSRVRRLEPLLAGRFARWTDENLEALAACRDLVSPEGQAVIDTFTRMRRQPLLSRLRTLRKLGLHRQTMAGQISLYAACLLKRL